MQKTELIAQSAASNGGFTYASTDGLPFTIEQY
jgi:hypothetical protein